MGGVCQVWKEAFLGVDAFARLSNIRASAQRGGVDVEVIAIVYVM